MSRDEEKDIRYSTEQVTKSFAVWSQFRQEDRQIRHSTKAYVFLAAWQASFELWNPRQLLSLPVYIDELALPKHSIQAILNRISSTWQIPLLIIWHFRNLL